MKAKKTDACGSFAKDSDTERYGNTTTFYWQNKNESQ